MKSFLLSLAVSLLLFTSHGFAQNTALATTVSVPGQPGVSERIGYYLYTPANTSTGSEPAIIFLHGNGECGDGQPASLSKLDNLGIMSLTTTGKLPINAYVFAPQLAPKFCTSEWPVYYIAEMVRIARLKTNGPIFLTGLSLGGGGVWRGLNDSAVCSQIAGAIPICGTATFSTAKWIAKYSVPVWAFHAENDGTIGVGNTTSAYTTIFNTGVKPAPKLTVFIDGGHAIWNRAYIPSATLFKVRNIWSWAISDEKISPTIYEWMQDIASGYATQPPVVLPPTPPPPAPKVIVARLFVAGFEVIVYSDKTSEVR